VASAGLEAHAKEAKAGERAQAKEEVVLEEYVAQAKGGFPPTASPVRAPAHGLLLFLWSQVWRIRRC
jgi:hypothetical protein